MKIFLSLVVSAMCTITWSGRNATAQNTAGQDTAAQSEQAQKHEPPAVLEIVHESVKEGRGAAHEKTESDFAAAFRKHNYPYYDLALTSMVTPNDAWFLAGFPSFAAVEEGDQMLGKPGVKTEFDMLDARDGELRSGTRTMFAVYRKDMSYRPDLVNVGKTRYVGITSFRVKLGHMHDFEEGSKKFLAADEKAGLKTPAVTYQVVAGAPADLVLIIEPMESLKSLDEYPAREKAVSEAMGEDYERMMKGAGEVFNSIEFNLMAVNPRMSYVSKDVEDSDPAFWRPKVSPGKTAAKPAEKAGQ